MGTRFYVTSAIALTISAFAGVLLGAIIALVRNELDRAAPSQVIVVEVPVTPSTSPASEIQHAGRLPPAPLRQETGGEGSAPRTSRTQRPAPPVDATTVSPTGGEDGSTSTSSPTDEPQPPTSSSRPGTSTSSGGTTPGDGDGRDETTSSTWSLDGDEPNEPSSTSRLSGTQEPGVTGIRADAAARP